MTLEAWVKPSALGTTWRTVVIKEQSTQLSYALYANNGRGRPSGHVYTDKDNQLAAPAALAVNQWSHVASTWDGTTTRLYVNGSLVASAPLSGTMRTSGNPLRIGGNMVWNEWFKGALDEVRVYNRALSAAEVAQDRDTPIGTSAATLRASSSAAAPVTPSAKATTGAKPRRAKKPHRSRKL
jgi:hypothetical protein